jgi:PAS domain S-box-containing protein
LVHDVTRERELAEQLTSQATQHAAVLSNLTAGIVLVDRQGHILAANPGAERIFGTSQAGLLGLNFFTCDWRTTRQDGSEIRIFAEMGARCFATGEAATGKICQLVGLDRCARWCSISVSVAEKNGHQQPITVVFSIADITESQEAARRSERLEAELQRSQKMEALGTLAGGIAHDFNNLLAIIMGHAELLGVHVAEEPTARSSVKAIGTAAARGAGLVQRILSFSRPRPPSRTPLLLSEIAREVLQLLKSTLPPAISIETHFAPNEVPVEADSGQLHQVFLNLFTNALQAMEDRKGVLRVAIETIEIDTNSKNSPSTLTPGSYVRARIEDSGCGMTETVRRRIFEPFFTTKSPGKGTGLGLAMVHGILTAHGAVISVASNPGRGTRFDLFFHPTRNSLPGTVTGGNQTADPVTDIHILLVDDEPEVLNLTRQMLSALGFQVTSTHLPTDAVKRFEAHPDEFDLLVTDFSMPVMNGRDLLQEIRRVRPQIPGVVISGLAGAIGWENGNIPERTVVLAKPFTSRALWEAIDEAKRTAQR